MIKHFVCGNEYEVTPDSFLNGSRCPECKWNIKKTTTSFKKEIRNLVGNEYEVLGEYEGANKSIAIKHNICGYEWNVKPSNFLFGSRCPVCKMKIAHSKRKKTQEEFEREVYELEGNEYEVVGKYEHALTKIRMKHNKCNTDYMVNPSDFLSGYRCPRCCESRGEKAISKYLRKNNISYRSQYKITDCRNRYPLPFDFAIFHKNKVLALIEYDGEQHFKPITHFGGVKNFNYIKHNDDIKTNYCISQGIPLIRIPYTVANLEEYLAGEISKLV